MGDGSNFAWLQSSIGKFLADRMCVLFDFSITTFVFSDEMIIGLVVFIIEFEINKKY